MTTMTRSHTSSTGSTGCPNCTLNNHRGDILVRPRRCTRRGPHHAHQQPPGRLRSRRGPGGRHPRDRDRPAPDGGRDVGRLLHPGRALRRSRRRDDRGRRRPLPAGRRPTLETHYGNIDIQGQLRQNRGEDRRGRHRRRGLRRAVMSTGAGEIRVPHVGAAKNLNSGVGDVSVDDGSGAIETAPVPETCTSARPRGN